MLYNAVLKRLASRWVVPVCMRNCSDKLATRGLCVAGSLSHNAQPAKYF